MKPLSTDPKSAGRTQCALTAVRDDIAPRCARTCRLFAIFLGLLPASILLSGCSAEPPLVIVNQPMVPVRLEHDGCPGWWLSDSLYEATLLRLEEAQER
ncbi:MAG: hypothetical protein ACI4RT_05355 [Candidatus Spyradenecus sp.]